MRDHQSASDQQLVLLPNPGSEQNAIDSMRGGWGWWRRRESKDTRIVVAEGQDVDLIVDRVSEAVRIPASAAQPTSTIVAAKEADYILGVARLATHLVILLDMGLLGIASIERCLRDQLIERALGTMSQSCLKRKVKETC